MRVGPHPAVGRLRKRSEFLAASSGRRFHTERMTVQGLRRAQPDGPTGGEAAGLRIGFTLTRKVGHATERNRIRRRLRAAIAESAIPFAASRIDVVVIGRRPAMEAPFTLLIEDLTRALATVTAAGAARRSRHRVERGDKSDSHV